MKAMFINGSVGAGKTSTLGEVGRILERRGVAHALIDLDWLRNAWPAPEHDRFNNALELQNLSAVVRNYVGAGAERIVLAGVIEVASMRSLYEAAVGVPLTICRLSVPVPILRARLALRHESESDLEWHLHRAGELDDILAAELLDDVAVEVENEPVAVIAERVLDAVGWS
ncbi:MAG: hypothetical protein ACOH1T_09310 [Microbacteriaceae bacterium]